MLTTTTYSSISVLVPSTGWFTTIFTTWSALLNITDIQSYRLQTLCIKSVTCTYTHTHIATCLVATGLTRGQGSDLQKS